MFLKQQHERLNEAQRSLPRFPQIKPYNRKRWPSYMRALQKSSLIHIRCTATKLNIGLTEACILENKTHCLELHNLSVTIKYLEETNIFSAAMAIRICFLLRRNSLISKKSTVPNIQSIWPSRFFSFNSELYKQQ